MNSQYYRQNVIAGLVVMAVGVAAFALTFGMPGNAPVFPRVASSLLFILGTILMVSSLISLKRGDAGKQPVAAGDFINPLYSVIIMVGYAYAITLAGFYTATVAMLIIYMYHLGIRSAKTIIGFTAVVAVLVYFVFTVQLDVPLPRGLLL